MRVISGTAKGRPLKAVPGISTRPTSDKVKEAVFSMIGPYFDGGIVLDLFAGTGALGIEALSRGAEQAIFVDRERIAVETVKTNLAACRFADRAEVYRNDAMKAAKLLGKRGLKFDYVFLDPPYKFAALDNLMPELAGLGLLRAGAVIVAEHDASRMLPEQLGPLNLFRRSEYGDTAVSLFEYDAEETDQT
jgi:16S rRNA (guanine(966)-N(2))-methyltransferase RsmD